MKRLKMWNRKALVLMAALLSLSISSPNVHAQSPTAQPSDSVRYNGTVLVRGGEAPPSFHLIEAVNYVVAVMAKIGDKGYYPLEEGNTTYNAVLVNGTNVTFVLKGLSVVSHPANGADNSTGYALIGPFLVKVSSDKILQISILSRRRPTVELLEAKVDGEAIAMIQGNESRGFWVPSLDGWIFEVNWTNEGDLSEVLICKNNTILSFSGLIKPLASEVELEGPVDPYTYTKLTIQDEEVSLLAYGPSVNLTVTSRLPIREFLGIYASSSGKYLVRVDRVGPSTYTILSPDRCDTCIVDGLTFVSDPSFSLDIGLDAPSEGIGGTSIEVSVDPRDASNLTLLLPGGRSVFLRNEGFEYLLKVSLPLPKTEIVAPIYLTGFSSDGIYGIEREMKILKAYDIRLLNGSRVFLVGGRGDLHILALNVGPTLLSLIEARLNLTTKRGDVLSLKFPLSIQLQGNGSQRILLPLRLPVGDYRGTLEIYVEDSSGEVHTISLGEISVVSTSENPLNALIAISPDLPSVGDRVEIKVTFTTMVPLSKILIAVNSSDELEPVTDTSKLVKDLPEGSTRELTFAFRAASVGPAVVKVVIYYSIEGEASERIYTKEIKIPIGGVSGRAVVEIDKRQVNIGEQVRLKIRIEDLSGNVTVEFPTKMSILEAKGRIRGNSVEFVAPGEIEVVGSFSEGGVYTIPTYISVNGSLLIPSNTVTVKVVGESGQESLEMSLRSRLADLRRRFKTLKEASGGLNPQAKEKMREIEDMLEEAKRLINQASYGKASEILNRAEAEISSLEEYTYSSLDELLNSLIYFLIGVGITSAILLAIRLRRRPKHGA